IDRLVERVKVITSICRKKVEVLLYKQPNQARMEGANLGDTVIPHRILRQAALTEGDVIHFHGANIFRKIELQCRGAGLGSNCGTECGRENEGTELSKSHLCALSCRACS